MVERRRRRGRLALYRNPAYLALLERVAVNVRRLREAQELTQQEAADQAEIALRMWQAIESAESNLTVLTLARVSAGLDVDPAELFGRVANPGRLRKRPRGRPTKA
jgi:transcriptional regulator with XRE-family HTH domain